MTSKSDSVSRRYERFVRAYMAGWTAGETGRQIARRCETTEGALFVHANFLRSQGVRLPRLRDRLDARYLNGVIRQSQKRKGVPS